MYLSFLRITFASDASNFRCRADGQLLVKKQISLLGLQDDDRNKAMQEADCLRSLKHPNIIELCEAFTEVKPTERAHSRAHTP
jgi:hypothetical protein